MLYYKINTWNNYKRTNYILKTTIIFFLLSSHILFAQEEKKTKIFPTAALSLQYAGSIGWLSAGYFRQTNNEKIELGFVYGFTPKFVGGNINTIGLKFIYNPIKIQVNNTISFEPIQTGFFITQNFGHNLHIKWPDQYEEQYYNWTNSTRFHIFLSTQASYTLNTKRVKKIAMYFETNTNELYFNSYMGNNNWKSLSITDIFFFGIGAKVYFQ